MTTLPFILALICAAITAVTAALNIRRAKTIKTLKSENKKLSNRLNRIAMSLPCDRRYEIEADRYGFHINLIVTVRVYSLAGEHIDTFCYCRIKSFPFADDKDFALLSAQELLDKLNEK